MASPFNFSGAAVPADVDPFALLPRIKVDNSFGAVLLGTCLGSILFGLNVHQSYRYFYLYPTDAWFFKCAVLLALGLEIMHSVLGIHICYYYLVTNYFHPEALLAATWSVKILTLNMSSIMFITKSFFACRVWLIGPKYRFLSAVVAFLLLGEIGEFCIRNIFLYLAATTAETFIQRTFVKFEPYTWLISAGYAVSLMTDGVLATSLFSVVYRNRQTRKREDTWLNVFVVYCINTGVLTCILSVGSLICSAVLSKTLIYVGFNIIVTRLYANTLLAVLNSRRSTVDHGAEGFESGSLGLGVPPKPVGRTVAERWNVPEEAPQYPTVINIKVTTDMVHDAESGDVNSVQEYPKTTSCELSEGYNRYHS